MSRITIEDAKKYLGQGEDGLITHSDGWAVYSLNNRLAQALCTRYDEASKTEQKTILGVLEAMNTESIDLTEYRSNRADSVYSYEPTGKENAQYIYNYLDKFIPKYLNMEYILQDIPF